MFACRSRIGLLLLALVSGAAAAHAYDHDGLARQALTKHIRPGYEAFANESAKLSAAANALCAAPSTAALKSARDAFKTATLAWGRIEHINFGAITKEKRRERLVFWPDLKGVMAKQIDAILTKNDETAFDDRLKGKSVAVQGLSALDAVLFGASSDELSATTAKDGARCRYVTALSSNIDGIASGARHDWAEGSSGEKEWLEPGAANPTYLSAKETTQALLQSYVSGVEALRDTRLKGQLGMQKVNAKALEPMFPGSGLALPYMRANIDGLRSLLIDGGFVARQSDPPENDPVKQGLTVLGSIDDELERAANAASAAEKLSPTPFADDKAREKLIAMGFPLKNAYLTGGQTIADQAGITLGFSPNDGD